MTPEQHSINQLSDGQRDCLRLVFQHKNSKEIARELDISRHTVDQRLRVAMRKLGVENRRQAAMVFASASGETPYQSLRYQPSQIAGVAPARHDPPRSDKKKETGAQVDNVLREAQQPFVVFADNETNNPRLSLPGLGRRKHDLTILEKLAWIVGIAFGAALSYGAILSGLEALSRYS